jgi:carbon storage regulator CsrA
MLILSRRIREKVVLPGLGVTLEVLAIWGRTVHLGIVAPREVKVLREELVGKPRPDADPKEQPAAG